MIAFLKLELRRGGCQWPQQVIFAFASRQPPELLKAPGAARIAATPKLSAGLELPQALACEFQGSRKFLICRLSTVVVQRFCKTLVGGPNLPAGANFRHGINKLEIIC